MLKMTMTKLKDIKRCAKCEYIHKSTTVENDCHTASW